MANQADDPDYYQLEHVGLIPGTYEVVFDATRYNTVRAEREINYRILTEVQTKYLVKPKAHPMHICRSTSLSGLEALSEIDIKILSFLQGEHPILPRLPFVEDRECGICLITFEEGDPVISTDCHHIYHRNCGLPWIFQTAGTETCPSCRRHIHRLYTGSYDKVHESMHTQHIKVLTAIHRAINQWRIIGLEFQSDAEAATSTSPETRFCKKIIIDSSKWIIIKYMANFGWISNSGFGIQAHAPTIQYHAWHCNPSWRAIMLGPQKAAHDRMRILNPNRLRVLVSIQELTKPERFEIEAEDFTTDLPNPPGHGHPLLLHPPPYLHYQHQHPHHPHNNNNNNNNVQEQDSLI